jgi:hypothetical protein
MHGQHHDAAQQHEQYIATRFQGFHAERSSQCCAAALSNKQT